MLNLGMSFESSVSALYQMVCGKQKRIESDADKELEDGKPNWIEIRFVKKGGSPYDYVFRTNALTCDIGRNEHNELCIRGPGNGMVSGDHCIITQNPNGFAFLRDTSRFGTEHNGELVVTDHTYELSEGDHIGIGLRKAEGETQASPACCTFSVHRVREDREGKKQKSS